MNRDARLRERCLGVLEGAATAAIGPAANGLHGDRVVDPDARPDGRGIHQGFLPPGGRVRRRARGAAARRSSRATDAERAGEIVVVAHGGTLRVLNAYLRGVPVERMRWEPLGNGCILRSPPGWPAVWPTPITNPDEKE